MTEKNKKETAAPKANDEGVKNSTAPENKMEVVNGSAITGTPGESGPETKQAVLGNAPRW